MGKGDNKGKKRQLTTTGNSPQQQQLKKMAYGQGPGLTEGNAVALGGGDQIIPNLATFLDQLKTLDLLTTTILESVEQPAAKLAIQQLQQITKTCGFLLQQERERSSPQSIEDYRRERSVVISGLPESRAERPTVRCRDDVKAVEELLDATEVEQLPLAVYRMGKPGQRPRLVKVEFPTRQGAALFLRNRGKLRQLPRLNTIFIRPSRTPEEREAHKLLQDDCTRKNQELPPDEQSTNAYVIYAGKVIRRMDIKKH